MTLRDLPHLVRRFVGSLSARRPGPHDQAFAASVLAPSAASRFFAQAPMDQGHALRCARAVEAVAPGRTDLLRAALLHDVGKAASGLGVVGRSVASLAAITHLPRSGRMQRYLDHGRIGAAWLAADGEPEIVVAFAAGHHGAPPAGVDPADWALLQDADRG